MKLLALIVLMICLGSCGLFQRPVVPLGQVRAENGLVTEVTGPDIPFTIGQPLPDLLRSADVITDDMIYRIFRGECTGSGRELRCDGGLQLFDSQGNRLSTFQTPDQAVSVGLNYPYAYVTWHRADMLAQGCSGAGGGVAVVDVSDPALPVQVGGYDVPGWTNEIWIRDSFAYLLTTCRLLVLDLTNPVAPRLAGTYAEDVGFPLRAAVDAERIYLVWATFFPEPSASLRVLDITRPDTPVLVSAYDLPEMSLPLRLVARDDLLYLETEMQTWQVFQAP